MAPKLDMDAMLAKIKDRQWALADIDWTAPGADTITDEMRPKLKAFMADLCWIENIGARGFAALAKKAPTPTIAEIYRYFHAEEQRHANAELALMKRWGMLEDSDNPEMPEPNVNIRLAMDWLDRYADDMSLSVLGTVIPMLEVALDGALLKMPDIDRRMRHHAQSPQNQPQLEQSRQREHDATGLVGTGFQKRNQHQHRNSGGATGEHKVRIGSLCRCVQTQQHSHSRQTQALKVPARQRRRTHDPKPQRKQARDDDRDNRRVIAHARCQRDRQQQIGIDQTQAPVLFSRDGVVVHSHRVRCEVPLATAVGQVT